MSVPARYPAALRLLHWVVAALVALQFGLATLNATVYESAPSLAEGAIQVHISLGCVILALMLARLGVRLTRPVPPLPGTMSPAKRRLARLSHAGLYAVLIAVPVTGWLKFALLGYGVPVFGLVPLPAFEFMPDWARRARTAHEWLAVALGGLLTLHISAALFHKRLAGQSVLPRMGIGQAA